MGLIENRFDPHILNSVYAERSEASSAGQQLTSAEDAPEIPRSARDELGEVFAWV